MNYLFFKDILFYAFFIVMAIILYRRLLRRMSKGSINQNDYCVLFSLELNPASGEIPFYFTLEKEQTVSLFIEHEDKSSVLVVEKTFKPGGHIVRFDSKQLADGFYYYILKTDLQETKKKFTIQNA
jgi:hypothetical protein